jgi:hypothetical protein
VEHLSQHGGPKIYYSDENVRLEEYFELESAQPEDVFILVARKIAFFHALFKNEP